MQVKGQVEIKVETQVQGWVKEVVMTSLQIKFFWAAASRRMQAAAAGSKPQDLSRSKPQDAAGCRRMPQDAAGCRSKPQDLSRRMPQDAAASRRI